jgi:hypothetical protein
MRRLVASLALFGLASLASAQLQDIPVSNWTVPPYTQSSAGGGFTTMTDITPAIPFVAVIPCRIVDTRAAAGFPAGYGPPNLSPGVPRNFDLNSGPCPGLPTNVGAYSLNVTVVNPSGPGHLVIYPQGFPQPTVSSINYVAGQTIANAVIVPSSGGVVTVVAGVSATEVLIDINGYFTGIFNPNNGVFLQGEDENGPIVTVRNTAACSGECGLSVEAGTQNFTAGQVPIAISGLARSGGRARGVHGGISLISSSGLDSAGVWGDVGFEEITTFQGGFSPAGVRGQAPVNGVVGVAGVAGVVGSLITPSAPFSILAGGILGYDSGPTNYGVWAQGGYGGSGAKFFVEPHPNDASKVIRYVSLEGPEAGTYFRGRGRFERGMARIPVPEDFRMVTDEEGLSVQITPIGGMASVGVLKADLNQIVVQASRNLEFYYLVQGVRRTHKHLTPIVEGNEYRPERADATMPAWLTEGQKQLLIQNGTYKPDGTVNVETAQRLGWDKVWAARGQRPSPEPTPE